LPLRADCDRVGKPVSKRWLALGYTARIFEWPRGLTVKNWTLRQRILASFAVIIAIMLLMVVVSYSRLLKIEVSEEKVRTDSVPGVYASSMIRSAWVDSYVLTQQIVGLSENHPISTEDQLRFKEFEQRLVKEMASYQATVFDKDDQAAFDDFERRHQTYNQILTKVLDLYQRKDFSQAQQVLQLELTPAWIDGRKHLNEVIENNSEAANKATLAIGDAVTAAKVSMGVSLLLAVLAAGVCGLLLMRAIMAPMNRIVEILDIMRTGDLSGRLNLERKDEFGAVETGFNDMMTELTALVSQAQRSSVQVTTSVTEIAATSKQQQATATETAATTTEIGATSREIAATSRDLVRTMTEVSTAADQASVLAGSGQQGLARMEDTMHSVMGAADLVNAKLAILNEKAGNINQVVVTIVKVADQTNLLSLNSAIEAEKAGEYGRGFAVVATEVRRLADQTAVATYDIEQMVREIQSAVSAGVMGMDKFSEEVRRGMAEVQQVGEQLSQIIHQVQALAPRVLMVNEGMQAQATGAEQINHALVQLGDASSQTVESLRQASFAIDELSQVAVGLRSGVSRFKV
jgi:methyl-accepting chemotaxis protein WspA